jgi:hypothetical protein
MLAGQKCPDLWKARKDDRHPRINNPFQGVLSASMRDLSDGPVLYKLSIENMEDSHEHQNNAT